MSQRIWGGIWQYSLYNDLVDLFDIYFEKEIISFAKVAIINFPRLL